MNKKRREILAAMQPVVDAAMKRPAYTDGVKVKALSDSATEITIYGAIGAGGWFDDGSSVSAAGFAQVMDEVRTPNISLRINSGGGDVFDGVAIHTMIARHPAMVTAYIDGIAASAASFIAMAADRIEIARNAMMMIHDGMTGTYGGPATHERSAELLHKVSDNIADMYAMRAGGQAAEWREIMSKNGEDGTWYTGREAVEAGLADEVAGSDDEEDDAVTVAHARKVLAHFDHHPEYKAQAPMTLHGGGALGDAVLDVIRDSVARKKDETEDVPPAPAGDDKAETMLAFLAERIKHGR